MTADEIALAVSDAGIAPLLPRQAQQFEAYLSLLLKWNAKHNLSSVRDASQIVSRHFIESIQCARGLPGAASSLLDYGSGAGFPGIPCAILQTSAVYTFAESQQKKAAFLREAVRALELEAIVHAGRVDTLTKGLTFDIVTLRAVDRMQKAFREALSRVRRMGWIAVMTTEAELSRGLYECRDIHWRDGAPLFGSRQRVLRIGQKLKSPTLRP